MGKRARSRQNWIRAIAGVVCALGSLTYMIAEAAVGRTSGSFNVSATGTASYSIPIFTPPGPRGLQPSVALNYSSSGGAGIAGLGWSLSYGGSTIHLCNKTVAQDGEAAAVRLLSPVYTDDALCLDGNRMRLQSGTYAASGSTYATEIANFSLLTAVGTIGYGPSSWTMKGKDGLIYTFGGTSDSRVLTTSYGSVSTVSAWRLSQIQDRTGNKILFTYKNPDSTTEGTTHPTAIYWTQTSAGSGTYLYSMEFSFSGGANAMPSSPAGYVADNTVRDTDLLTSISIKKSGATVRKYVLAYENSPTTSVKRMTSVTECSDASATDCLSPTTIAYQNGSVGVAASPSFTAYGDITMANGRFDYNGDGLLDLTYFRAGAWYVRFASTSGYGSEKATGHDGWYLMAGDPFGKGRDVLMGLNGTSTWHAFSWNGSYFDPISTGITYTNTADVVSLTDVDGDGRDDLVYVTNPWPYAPFTNDIQLGTRASTSTGTTLSFASEVAAFYIPTPIAEGWNFVVAYGASVYPSQSDNGVLGDIDSNGDGRKDVMVMGGETFFCSSDDCWMWDYSTVLRPYTDGSSSYQYEPGFNSYGWPLYSSTHLNNDRCTDFVKFTSDELLHSGCMSGFGLTTAAGDIRGTLDWDGDGRQDLLTYNGYSTLYLQRSTGEGLTSAVDTGLSVGCDLGYYCLASTNLFVTDANGDGLEDLGYLDYGSSISVHLHNGSGVVPDRAVTFTDGYGVTQTVAYVHSTHEGYTPGTGAAYPQKDVKSDRLIVRTVTATDGAGGTFTTTYDYFGATEDVKGRGFEGFDKIESVDSRNSIKQVRKYSKAFPYTGMLIEEASYQSDTTLISKRTIAYDQTILDATTFNERRFTFAASSIEDVHEVGGPKNGDWITRTTTGNTFDTNNNLIASAVEVTDKDTSSPFYGQWWKTETSQTFDAYATDRTTYWCLGLPISESVTRSSSVAGETTVSQTKGFSPNYEFCRHTAESIGSGALQVETTYGYTDDFGNVTSVSIIGRNPNGSTMTARTVGIGWSTTGQFPVSETNALSQSNTRTFDSTFGSLLTESDPNGIVVASNEYDAFGRITRSIRADGTATRISYAACSTYGCENGDPASGATSINKTIVIASERSTSDSQIRDSWTYLDQFGRPILQKVMNAAGGYSRTGTQYDALGRTYRQTAPCDASSCTAYWVTNTYDLVGRPATQSRPQSQSVSTPVTTTFGYAGRTQTITDAQSKVTTKIMDVKGRTRRSQDHNGYYQSFAYDSAGSVKEVTDSLSNTLFGASYSYGIKSFQTATTDMDLGAWSYTYNSLGELVSWVDAKSQSFSQAYDALSRVTSRTEAEGTTTFTYGTSAAGHNIGRLESVSMSGYSESFSYDSVGRLSTHTVTTDQTYDIDYAYNNQGLIDAVTYPTSTSSVRVKVKYGYDHGILKSVTDWTAGSAGAVYWTSNTQNARGQTTQETLGNGVVTNRAFDAVTGLMSSMQSAVGGGTTLQNQSYLYDLVGNVTQRQENTQGLTENFYYDNLYRLDYSQLNSSTNLDLSYDAMGNITNRTDVNGNAAWTYHSTKKHAVTTTGSGGVSFSYDANGNMTSRAGSTISWSSYNYATGLATATENTAFYYGPDRQYYKQIYTGPSGTETTHYIAGLLEKVYDGSVTDWRHSVVAEGQVVAIVSRKSTSANAVYYPLDDNQGSGSVLTDSSGANLVRQSYNAFGLPRDGADWDGAVSSGDKAAIGGISRRGYTGHSMLGDMGLIHMNGRVQDAITGRFLSPDPTTPNPGFTQSYNRYAYVNNNPMSFIDPSGFTPISFIEGSGMRREVMEWYIEQCSPSFEGYASFEGDYEYFCGIVAPEYAGMLERYDAQQSNLAAFDAHILRFNSLWQEQQAEEEAKYQRQYASYIRGITSVQTPRGNIVLGELEETSKCKTGFLADLHCYIGWGRSCSAVDAMTDEEALSARMAQEFSVPMMGIGSVIASLPLAGAARGVLPQAAARIDPARIREIERLVRSGESAFPLDTGAQLRAVGESLANNVRVQVSNGNMQRAGEIRDAGLWAIDNLDRFAPLTPVARQQLRDLVIGAFGK